MTSALYTMVNPLWTAPFHNAEAFLWLNVADSPKTMRLILWSRSSVFAACPVRALGYSLRCQLLAFFRWDSWDSIRHFHQIPDACYTVSPIYHI